MDGVTVRSSWDHLRTPNRKICDLTAACFGRVYFDLDMFCLSWCLGSCAVQGFARLRVYVCFVFTVLSSIDSMREIVRIHSVSPVQCLYECV